MDLVSLRNAYRRYANYYDYLFGPVLHPGRKLAVTLANTQPDQCILEVGVGTGLSLPFYRTDSRVIGIDLSPEMLAKARQRVVQHRLDHVEMLTEMNAEHLTFPDGQFDVVVAMYVASVVSNPARMVDEMRRVCKSGGDIIIVNHFISEHALLQRIETLLRPLSGMLGFRPDMRLDSLPDYPDFYRVQIINTNFFGYWKVIHYRNEVLSFEPPNEELQILERPL